MENKNVVLSGGGDIYAVSPSIILISASVNSYIG
jgi:hypothetical protein